MRFKVALAALGLVTPAIVFLAPPASADPSTDIERIIGCWKGVVQDTLNTVEAWRVYADDQFQQVKCKLKLRPTGVRILKNSDFWLVPGLLTNKQQGVIGGTGTASDPFLISGHEWTGRTACPAITIENTDAHVRISGNWIHEMSCLAGVVVRNAKNVDIRDNRFSANDRSIFVSNVGSNVPACGTACAGLTVENNVFEAAYGASVKNGNGAIQYATAQRAPSQMIWIENSAQPKVKRNVFQAGAGFTGSLATSTAVSISGGTSAAYVWENAFYHTFGCYGPPPCGNAIAVSWTQASVARNNYLWTASCGNPAGYGPTKIGPISIVQYAGTWRYVGYNFATAISLNGGSGVVECNVADSTWIG